MKWYLTSEKISKTKIKTNDLNINHSNFICFCVFGTDIPTNHIKGISYLTQKEGRFENAGFVQFTLSSLTC